MSEDRWLFLDRAIGETRGLIVHDGRPERLVIQRDGDDPVLTEGARSIARVRKIEKVMSSAFLELPGGAEAILALKPDMPPLVQGGSVEIEIKSEPRNGKLAVARFIEEAKGAPRLTAEPGDLAEQLMLWAGTEEVFEGPEARAAIDEAEEEILLTVHALPGGGTISIEPTRALIAVDVDLGDRGGQDSKKVTRNANMTALTVGARLMRLKGLGGLVVYDLVGRGHDGHALLGVARKAFAPDNPGVAIGAISRFGTMEMTIPRRRRSVLEILRGPDGRLTHQTLALRLVRMIEREGAASPGGQLRAFCAPAVAKAVEPYLPKLRGKLGSRFEVQASDRGGPEHLEVVSK